MPLYRPFAALTVALAAILGPALPATALAQTAPAQASPVVTGFGVTPVEQLRPGEVLAFKLEGTPGARVSVQIDGATVALPLTEVATGRYEGEYTVRQKDRLTAGSGASARLEKDGQVVTATLAQPLQTLGASAGSPISSFHVSAPAQVQPGDELILALHGMPGGHASASVQGIAQRIALTEVKPGVYEGAYVVRRKDNLHHPLVADGRLLVNKREATLRYAAAEHGGHGSSQPVVSCGHCGSVTAVKLVTVKDDHPNVLGTIAGGVIGGVLGHQVGGGTGRDLATIAGAVGGAYAGNRIENNMNKRQVHRVSVRLDNGTTRTFDYAQDPGLKPGARIKVVNNALERN
jgi:outer membrane lipoprotein SlyB